MKTSVATNVELKHALEGDNMFVEPLSSSMIYLVVVAIVALVVCLTFSNLKKGERCGKQDKKTEDNIFKKIFKENREKPKNRRWH